MNLSFPQLLFGAVGALLIYSAVTGKMPNSVVKGQFGFTNNGQDSQHNTKGVPLSAVDQSMPLPNNGYDSQHNKQGVPLTAADATQVYP